MDDLPTTLPLLDLPEAGLRPLLLAVQECLDDDLPRRALADWLEEHGDARAELIRAGLAGHGRRVARWGEVYGERWFGSLPRGARVEVPDGVISLVWPADGSAAGEGARLPAGLRGAVEEGWFGQLVLEELSFNHYIDMSWLRERIPRLRWLRARSWADRLAGLTTRELDLSHSPELDELQTEGGMTALETLRLRDCPRLGQVRLADAPRLTALDLSGCPRLGSVELTRLPALRHLDLERCGWLADLRARDLPALAALPLGGSPQLALVYLRDLPGVASLDLSQMAALREVTVVRLPALQELDLSDCRELARLDLEGLDGLRRLSLRHCESLTDHAFARVAKLPALRELDLSHCGLLERLALRGLAHLESLSLDGCEALRDLRLERVPALRQLSLRHCPRVEVSFLGDLAWLPSLSELDLWSGPRWGDAALNEAQWPRSLEVLRLGWAEGPADLKLSGLPALRVFELHPGAPLRTFEMRGPSRLRALDLSGRPGLRSVRLERLPALVELSLTACPALRRLGLVELPELHTVRLAGCASLGDDAVDALAALPALQLVHLGDARSVSRAAIHDLRARLPRCRVQT